MGRYQQKNEAISAPKNGAISARVDKSAHRRKVSSSLSCLISLLAFQKSWKSFKFENLEVGKVDYDYVVLLLYAQGSQSLRSPNDPITYEGISA